MSRTAATFSWPSSTAISFPTSTKSRPAWCSRAILRSHRTAMDALGEGEPESELQRVIEDWARLGSQ